MVFTHPKEDIAIQEGAMAPDFTLQDTEGKAHTLSERVKDKPVVLVFYRGDWCAWCQLQTAQLAKAHNQFVEAGVEIWAISPQAQERNEAFRLKREIQYPILADENQHVIRTWGLINELDEAAQYDIPYPTTYIIDRNGRVHWRRLGRNPEDRPTPEEILSHLP